VWHVVCKCHASALALSAFPSYMVERLALSRPVTGRAEARRSIHLGKET
jgi:hypothetical protein